jgi:drug/metabolite transporter (DMT)-like permease
MNFNLINVLFLLIPVILSTAIWPINRRVMQNGGRGDVYGFWISTAAALVAGILAFASHQSITPPSLWKVGLLVGFSFSFGFCIVVNYCLKIGPTGPTVAANNMGLIGPVVVGLIWPVSQPLTLPLGIGIVLILSAILGFSFSASGSEKTPITTRWAILAVVGWLLAALSMTGQYLGSVLNPTIPLSQVFAFSLISMLILLPFVIRRGKSWFNKAEFLGGALNGLIQALSLFMTQLALQRMPSKIVFPVTVLTPLILVLIISGLIYKERLSRQVWLSCGVGVLGLVILVAFQ